MDTSSIDKALTLNEGNARELRAKIKGYGDIDLTPIERMDVSKLRAMLQDLKADWNRACSVIELENEEIQKHNNSIAWKQNERKRFRDTIISLEEQIVELREQLRDVRDNLSKVEESLRVNPPKRRSCLPNKPDTYDLEKQIDDGIAANVRHEQYQKNLERDKQRKADQHSLSTIELATKNMREERSKKILEVNQGCPIKGLEFKEDGTFTYQGTSAGMLSGSQVMKLSSELSALYPEGLGLDLIDRAESLGKSIFTFIERAQKEKKTILATIVGEKPTKVPENVGVFVVENGKIK